MPWAGDACRRLCTPFVTLSVIGLLAASHPAAAQQPASPDGTTFSDRRELISKDWHFVGNVEMELRDTRVYASEIWFYTEQKQVVAAGNVVFSQGSNRIAADRAEVDTETQYAKFYNASGFANVQQSATPNGPPVMTGEKTDVYFFGETIEKMGSKKYKIVNGGFSTCLQPTPRWEISAGTLELNIDDYTLIRQAIFKVKGVPLLYVPILYYPTTKEDRATGILLPTYGFSTIRGQTISNAFFWAINRSHDATLMHDWYSKTGQGYGGEYRYNVSPGSEGAFRTYLLNQQSTTYSLPTGVTGTLAGSRSFEIQGGASQRLPRNFLARARADYFSSLTAMQTFSVNVSQASRNQRFYGGNVVGGWGSYSLNGTFDHSETFYNSTQSVVIGNSPRITLSRNERPITPRSQLYFSTRTEFANLDRQTLAGTAISDSSLARVDFSPQLRYPFKKWQWFTVNSSVSWRETFYTRSKTPIGTIADDNVNRQYYTLAAQAVGPVFNRIWNTPDSGYAERFKHTVEPFLGVQRTSSIDNFNEIVQIDGVDAIVGNATSYTYGLRNRFYAKRRMGPTSRAMEIVSVELTQSYYTDERSAQYDLQYATSFSGAPPSRFSPIQLSVRATPTNSLNAMLRAEFDSRHRELRTISATGNYSFGSHLQTSASWSQRFFIKDLIGFNNPLALDNYINSSVNLRTSDNKFGGSYNFNYDILRSRLLQQRVNAFYNAQCCGLTMEYQRYNFAGINQAVPADRRFFISFTLAGLGNFSPFSGANGAINSTPR